MTHVEPREAMGEQNRRDTTHRILLCGDGLPGPRLHMNCGAREQDELPNAALLVVKIRKRLATLTIWTPNSIKGSRRHDITMFSQGN